MPQALANCTNYKCDHCGKKYFRKCDASRHEKFCNDNPNNLHLCFMQCKNLVRGEEEWINDCEDSEYGLRKGTRTVFSCQLTGQKMFSYVAERKRHPVVKEADTIRMPLACDKYTAKGSEDYWNEIFG